MLSCTSRSIAGLGLLLIVVGCANAPAQAVERTADRSPSQALSQLRADLALLSGDVELQSFETEAIYLMLEQLAGQLSAHEQEGSAIARYAVKPGDSLWSIAEQIYGDPFQWIGIYSLNFGLVQNPDNLYPGQILFIP